MSFESFINNIEELHTLPILEKGEGGYFYPEEYHGNLYRHGTSLMYVTRNATDDIQIPLIEAIYNAIEGAISDDVKDAITSSLESIKSVDTGKIEKDILQISDDVSSTDNMVLQLKGETKNMYDLIQILEDKLLELAKSTDSKLESAIKLEPEVNIGLIQKLIDKKLEDSPAKASKVKISTLGMLKESGFSIDEISKLAKNDLI